MYMTKLDFQTIPHSTPDEITPDEQDAIDAWLAENEVTRVPQGESAFSFDPLEKKPGSERVREMQAANWRIMLRKRRFAAAARKRGK